MTDSLRKIGGSARFSAISIHNGQVHLAGQVSQLKDGDITAQSRDVFAKVDDLLDQAGTTRENLISVQIWDEWVAPVTPPTRVCVEARMAQPHYLIEVLAIAAAD